MIWHLWQKGGPVYPAYFSLTEGRQVERHAVLYLSRCQGLPARVVSENLLYNAFPFFFCFFIIHQGCKQGMPWSQMCSLRVQPSAWWLQWLHNYSVTSLNSNSLFVFDMVLCDQIQLANQATAVKWGSSSYLALCHSCKKKRITV